MTQWYKSSWIQTLCFWVTRPFTWKVLSIYFKQIIFWKLLFSGLLASTDIDIWRRIISIDTVWFRKIIVDFVPRVLKVELIPLIFECKILKWMGLIVLLFYTERHCCQMFDISFCNRLVSRRQISAFRKFIMIFWRTGHTEFIYPTMQFYCLTVLYKTTL